MKACIEESACIGCGLCETICPEVFEMEEDLAKVIADPVPDAAEDDCKAATEGCPVDAITIRE